VASVEHTFDMTMYMLVGGIGTLLGPLLGAIGVPWLTQYLQVLQDYRFVVFGPLLVILVIFLPYGIVGTWMNRKRRKEALAAQAAPAASRDAPALPTAKGASHA
jgi:branched-chain amino acid transport system permease protein